MPARSLADCLNVWAEIVETRTKTNTRTRVPEPAESQKGGGRRSSGWGAWLWPVQLVQCVAKWAPRGRAWWRLPARQSHGAARGTSHWWHLCEFVSSSRLAETGQVKGGPRAQCVCVCVCNRAAPAGRPDTNGRRPAPDTNWRRNFIEAVICIGGTSLIIADDKPQSSRRIKSRAGQRETNKRAGRRQTSTSTNAGGARDTLRRHLALGRCAAHRPQGRATSGVRASGGAPVRRQSASAPV